MAQTYGTRWIIITDSGDEITLTANQEPTELVVAGVASRLEKLGKSGYLVSINGPLSGDVTALMREERSFGAPAASFDDVKIRYSRRRARGGNPIMRHS